MPESTELKYIIIKREIAPGAQSGIEKNTNVPALNNTQKRIYSNSSGLSQKQICLFYFIFAEAFYKTKFLLQISPISPTFCFHC